MDKLRVYYNGSGEPRKRCCCNCRHDIRERQKDGPVNCHCEIDGHYIGYLECFDGWCRRWAKDHTFDKEVDNETDSF